MTTEFHCPECCPEKKKAHHEIGLIILGQVVSSIATAVIVLLLTVFKI